jgi:hypothetical protein
VLQLVLQLVKIVPAPLHNDCVVVCIRKGPVVNGVDVAVLVLLSVRVAGIPWMRVACVRVREVEGWRNQRRGAKGRQVSKVSAKAASAMASAWRRAHAGPADANPTIALDRADEGQQPVRGEERESERESKRKRRKPR